MNDHISHNAEVFLIKHNSEFFVKCFVLISLPGLRMENQHEPKLFKCEASIYLQPKHTRLW